MRFRIHFTVGNTNDSIVVAGDSIEEIREQAASEIEKRGGSNPWSEEL
jgi:hypothetical protein